MKCCLSEEWEYQSMSDGRFPANDWTIDDVKFPMHQEGNLYDCGIFTCMFGS